MAERIGWNHVTQALNGPSLSGQGELEDDANDKIEATSTDDAMQQVTAMHIIQIYYPYFF